MMNDLFADIGYISLNHTGEELCGDMVEIVRKDNELTAVLADGLGSGVKANILSTLTSKIISTMISENMSVDECVKTIASTLPVCKEREVAYSTFTIIKITDNKRAEIIQFDNPAAIMLRNGKNFDYPVSERIIEGKKIHESKIDLENDDVFILTSDGAVYAGAETVLNYGWQRENIIAFAESHYDYKKTAKIIAAEISDECNRLYDYKPSDDTTVLAIQIRKRKCCSVAFGPPENKDDDNKMMSLFFSKNGKHIVCGGTTSKIASHYLGKEIQTINNIGALPPISKIEGVDLVTEGFITIARVLDYARDYLSDNSLLDEWEKQKTGAGEIARILFKEATDINLFVGRAKNEAHQNTELNIKFKLKMIEELKQCLESMNKTVIVNYF